MDLHGRIMNLPLLRPADVAWTVAEQHAAKLGHRAARHAAAELALKADAIAVALKDICEVMNALGDAKDIDVTPYIWNRHECLANLIAAEEAMAAWEVAMLASVLRSTLKV